MHVAPIASGYTADLCRTLFVGNVASDAAKAFETYLEAQEAGIAAAINGTSLPGIDDVMSGMLKKSGYEDAFLRPVFHGSATRVRFRSRILRKWRQDGRPDDQCDARIEWRMLA